MQKIIELVKERIRVDENNFNKRELKIIKNNMLLAVKLYSLGNVNAVNSILQKNNKYERGACNENV